MRKYCAGCWGGVRPGHGPLKDYFDFPYSPTAVAHKKNSDSLYTNAVISVSFPKIFECCRDLPPIGVFFNFTLEATSRDNQEVV